jgi:hypothetical protein
MMCGEPVHSRKPALRGLQPLDIEGLSQASTRATNDAHA